MGSVASPQGNYGAYTMHTSRLRRWLIAGLRISMLCLALLALTGGYFWFTTDMPDITHLRARASRGNTRILDRHGQLLYEIPDPFQGRFHPVPLEDIPLALQQATIAIEDQSFYDNQGIDGRAIARALWSNIQEQSIVAGGSTITQQLVRSFLLDPHLSQQQTLNRKLREATLAVKLTTQVSKDDILELYLNQIYYGGMAYGVEATSQHVFGKPVHTLDLAECALLAGLPQAPTAYNPLTHPEAALARQAQVLDAMVRNGYITAAQATTAQNEPLQFASDDTPIHAPHGVFYALDTLTEWLEPDIIARGGLTITTTLDLDLHNKAHAIVQRHIASLAQPGYDTYNHQVQNGAAIILNPHTGEILAMVGSPDFYDSASQGQVNATLALRQAGSAIKPLTYAAALERGWTAATPIQDEPVSFTTREGRPYTPENYDRAYHGTLSLRQALATSSNVAAVRVLDAIGIPAFLDMAQRLGITTLTDRPGAYGLALTLGSGEVSLLELTTAYAAFANDGNRVTPSIIQAIDFDDAGTEDLNHTGRKERKDWTAEQSDRHRLSDGFAITPQVAYLITDILSDRYARMRAFGATSSLDIGRPAAVKTGTTTNWRDNWTLGYTPDRVVGVWVGNASGQEMEMISGISGAGPIWHDVMQAAHRNIPPRPFPRPDGIVEMPVCAAPPTTPDIPCTATRLERFIAGTEPASGALANVIPHSGNEVDSRKSAQTQRSSTDPDIVYDSLPEHSIPKHPQNQQSSVLAVHTRQDTPGEGELITPAAGSHYAISPLVPREQQQLKFQARTTSEQASISFFVDNTHLATCDSPPYHTFWYLAPGHHTVYIEVARDAGQVWRSPPIRFTVGEVATE